MTIKEIRTKENLTQEEMAYLLQIPVNIINDWETGKKTISELTIKDIEEMLKSTKQMKDSNVLNVKEIKHKFVEGKTYKIHKLNKTAKLCKIETEDGYNFFLTFKMNGGTGKEIIYRADLFSRALTKDGMSYHASKYFDNNNWDPQNFENDPYFTIWACDVID